MAKSPKAKAGASGVPVYLHSPASVVVLKYPFRIGSAVYRRVPLWPPSLDNLQIMAGRKGAGALDPQFVISCMSPLSEEVALMCRWTDTEAILAEAKNLLPPEMLTADPVPETVVEADPILPPGGPIAGDDQDPGDPSDFLFDPARGFDITG